MKCNINCWELERWAELLEKHGDTKTERDAKTLKMVRKMLASHYKDVRDLLENVGACVCPCAGKKLKPEDIP